MKHLIKAEMPTVDGQYVCYVENEFLPAFTDRKILMWFDGQWSYPMSDQKYRGRVFGWIGPLPVMKVEDFFLYGDQWTPAEIEKMQQSRQEYDL